MSTFALKTLAIIAMLIDHIGAVFISPYTQPELHLLFRGIGRLAMPIFVFLVVEGYYHTRNVKKYLKRMAIFALISEIPFDLAFYSTHYKTNVLEDIAQIYQGGFKLNEVWVVLGRLFEHQNVFFTLFLGLLLIHMINMIERRVLLNQRTLQKLLICNILEVVITVLICFTAVLLKTDYDYRGILIFLVFYIFRGKKILTSLYLFLITATLLSNIPEFVSTRSIFYVISLFANFAMIPIALYNGKKGKDVKYLFYIFYPAHLFIIFLIYQFI